MDATSSGQPQSGKYSHLSDTDGAGSMEYIAAWTDRSARDDAIHPMLAAMAHIAHDVASDAGRADLAVFRDKLAATASDDASLDDAGDAIILTAILEVARRHATRRRVRHRAERYLRRARRRRTRLAARHVASRAPTRTWRHMKAMLWRHGLARHGLGAASAAIIDLPDRLRDRAAKRMLAAALCAWHRYLARQGEPTP